MMMIKFEFISHLSKRLFNYAVANYIASEK
jgi:hypothetical protein